MSAAPEPSTSADATREGFDPRILLAALFKHKWMILGAVTLVTVLTVFWTARQPRIFEAACSLEYDPNPPRPLRGEIEDVADPIGNYWMTQEFYKTQNRVLSSRAIAERVVQKLGLHRNAKFMGIPREERANWRPATPDAAALVLLESVTVEQEPDTRIVQVRVRNTDPELATLLANTIVDAYIEKTMEDRLGATVSALEWLSTQLEDLKTQLGESELALHEFKRANNVLSLSLEDRQNIVANDIEHFSKTLTEARTRRIELQSRLARLRAANREDPMQIHAALVLANETVSALRASFREKAAELDAVSLRYGPAHPKILSLESELDSLRTQMRSEIDGLIESSAAELDEVRGTETGLSAALDTANTAGLELNLHEIAFSRLNRERDNKAKLYGILLERTTETNLTKLLRVTHVRVLDRALKPLRPVSPKILVNISVGVVTGLLLGFGLAFMRTRMDRTIRAAPDAEALGLTVLGLVPIIEEDTGKKKKGRPAPRPGVQPGEPLVRDLIVHTHPMSSAAECCRAVRTNLTFMSADNPLRTFVITSANMQEGKTTVATNLAIAIAQSGKRVLLIDTDLRRPRIHRTFGVSAAVGVTSVLVNQEPLANAVQETVVPGLLVLPCGPIPPNPSELLHTARFRDMLRDASQMFDQVILDSPPLGAVTDAAIIAPQVQGALIVIRSKRTTIDSLRSALRQLHDVSATIIGGVLNDVDLTERLYGYGHYHSYYYYRREGYYTSEPSNEDGDESRRTAAE